MQFETIKEIIFWAFIAFLCFCVYVKSDEIDIGCQYSSGINDILQINSKLKISHYDSTRELSLNTSYFYGWINGEQIINKGNATGMYDRNIFDRWTAFVFATPEFDESKQIDFRFSGGTGLKYKFTKYFSISGALLGEYNLEQTDKARLSIRPKLKTNNFNAIFFYKPNLKAFKDYLLDCLVVCTIKPEKWAQIAFKVGFRYDYDSQSRQDNAGITNSLVWRFK